jgi:hypothetical protein
MEYFDSIGKTDLQIFYMNKSSRLLLNEKVVELLDNNKVNLNELGDIKLFKTNPYQVFKKNRRRSMSDHDLPVINYTPTYTETDDRKSSLDRKLRDKKEIKQKSKQEVVDFDSKLDKISSNISKDLSNQMSKFEEMKKKKLEKQMNSNQSKLALK